MSADIIPFDFEELSVRVVMRDDEPWFVAADICRVLGHSNTTMALKALDEDELTLSQLEGSHRLINLISGSGLYALVIRSDKPAARRFRKWITSDVLPAIRRTGRYDHPGAGAAGAEAAAQILESPAAMRSLLLTYTEKVIALQGQVEDMRDDVAAHERLTRADGSLNITEAAKNLGMRPRDLFDWLAHNGWIYKRPGAGAWLGYQTKCNQGLLEHKTTTVLRADGSEKITEQVRITAKGLATLARVIRPTARLIS